MQNSNFMYRNLKEYSIIPYINETAKITVALQSVRTWSVYCSVIVQLNILSSWVIVHQPCDGLAAILSGHHWIPS